MLLLDTLVFDKRFFFNADISGRLQGTSNCLPFQRAIVSILYCYRDYTLVRFSPGYIDHVSLYLLRFNSYNEGES